MCLDQFIRICWLQAKQRMLTFTATKRLFRMFSKKIMNTYAHFRLKTTCCCNESLILSCKGLDTLATIRVNDRELGKTNNMHRDWGIRPERYFGTRYK